MLKINEIINELDGQGLEQGELLDITTDLTQLSIIKDRIVKRLSPIYSEDEVSDMISIVKRPNVQQIMMNNALLSLSKREKECYFKHTMEQKSFSAIGRELGVSKGTVQQSIERARRKLEFVKAN